MNCRKCNQPMRQRNSPDDGRRVHKARGLCGSCYGVEQRTGTINRWATIGNTTAVLDRAERAAIVENVEFMQATGAHPEWWAPRLGISHATLARRLYRAGRPDLGRHVNHIRDRGKVA